MIQNPSAAVRAGELFPLILLKNPQFFHRENNYLAAENRLAAFLFTQKDFQPGTSMNSDKAICYNIKSCRFFNENGEVLNDLFVDPGYKGKC